MTEAARENVIDLTAAVEARLREESDQIAAASKGPQDKGHGGPDDPRFVRQCLEANERGDGVLAATIHQGQFVYVKSRDEKSKAWYLFNGIHWEVDKADDHMIIPENVALVFEREGDRLKDVIAEARDKADTASRAADRLAKHLKQLIRDEAPEDAIAEIERQLRTEELTSRTTAAELKGLIRLQKDYYDRCDRLRSIRGAKNCLEYSHKIGKGGLYIYGDEVDKKPNLIPCLNCVVDLETGEALKGRPEDYLVRAIPIRYVPGAARQPWEQFIAEIHEHHPEKIAFIKRWWGYCLTGYVKEQMYIMFTGAGANGKGTMLEIMQEIFGELSKQIMAEMIVKTKNTRSSTSASPDILALQGRRWVYVDETNDGDRANDAELKRTTGGNRRSARGLFDKFDTDFRPTHKLSIITNHPLKGIAETYSLKRRLIYMHYPLIYDPDPVVAAKADPGNAHLYRQIDKDLDAKLREVLEGILAWTVEGSMEWFQSGLAVPQCLIDAVEDVRAKEDTLGQFLASKVEIGEGLSVPAKDFLAAYQKWYVEEGHSDKWKPTRNHTYDKLRAKGFSIPDNRTTCGATKIFGLDLKVMP